MVAQSSSVSCTCIGIKKYSFALNLNSVVPPAILLKVKPISVLPLTTTTRLSSQYTDWKSRRFSNMLKRQKKFQNSQKKMRRRFGIISDSRRGLEEFIMKREFSDKNKRINIDFRFKNGKTSNRLRKMSIQDRRLNKNSYLTLKKKNYQDLRMNGNTNPELPVLESNKRKGSLDSRGEILGQSTRRIIIVEHKKRLKNNFIR